MRKSKPKIRITLPDPKFNEVVVTKFVNNLMMQGKKNISYEIFYDAIDIVSEKTNEDGLEVWRKALPPETLHTTETSWVIDKKTIIELYLIWHMTGVMDLIKGVDEGLFDILVDVMEERLEDAGYEDVTFD